MQPHDTKQRKHRQNHLLNSIMANHKYANCQCLLQKCERCKKLKWQLDEIYHVNNFYDLSLPEIGQILAYNYHLLYDLALASKHITTQQRMDIAMQTTKTIAIIVGHDNNAQGAYSPFLAKTEYQFNKELANAIALHQDENTQYHIILRDKIGIRGAYEKAKHLQANLVLELHFNSFSKESANGIEVLIAGTNNEILSQEHQIAESIIIKINEQLEHHNITPLRDRGVIELNKTKNGYRNMTQLEDRPCLLLETFFGSNKLDCQRIHALGLTTLGFAIHCALTS